MTNATFHHLCNRFLPMRWLAAGCDPRHHCALALAVNAGLVACGAVEPFTPALALHLVLLPFNAWRLVHALRAAPAARPSTLATPKGGVAVTQERARSLRCAAFDPMATMQTVRLDARRSG